MLARSGDHLDVGVYGARGIPSTYSGYETFLTAMLPRLVAAGHSVTMYCRKGEVPPMPQHEGVKLRHLPALRSKALSTVTHGLVAAVAARRARHDVLLVVNVANAPYCGLSRWTGQPVVLNVDGQEWLRGKWGRAARWYFRQCARLARHTATTLVTDCNAMAEVYRQQFRADSAVIPYCWTELDDEDPSSTDGLERLGVSRGGYFIVAGRLNPENNIERIVESFVRSKSNLKMLVLGVANYDSPVQLRLNELAQSCDNVILGGHVGDRGLFGRLLRHSAAYLHGHTVGGMNPSLVEAMGCGAAVIAYRTPFNEETLGGTGVLFEDFEHELPSLLRRVEDGKDIGCRPHGARERARCEFALDRVMERYESVLRSAAGLRSAVADALAEDRLPFRASSGDAP